MQFEVCRPPPIAVWLVFLGRKSPKSGANVAKCVDDLGHFSDFTELPNFGCKQNGSDTKSYPILAKTALKYYEDQTEFQKRLQSSDAFIAQYNTNKKIVDFNEIPLILTNEFFTNNAAVISELL